MSIRVMSHVWEHSDARLGARLVLLAIADFANDTGMAWPSVETLAAKSRISPRQVQRILRQLVDSGDLILHQNAGPHGCHLYQVVLTKNSGEDRHIVRGDKSSGVTNSAGGVTNPAKNMSKMSPEPSIEPSKNHQSKKARSGRRRSPNYTESFESFWVAYPSGHGNKKTTFEQWKRIAPDDDLQREIMAGLERWKASRRWQEGYVKSAHIWLRDRWWEDEVPADKPGGTRKADSKGGMVWG